MSSNPFAQFIKLVTSDQKIQLFRSKILVVDNAIAAINHKQKEYEILLNDMIKKINQLKKNVDAQELEMKTFDQQENEKKQQLNTRTDYRECQAIKNEIEAIQRLQADQELVILDLWNQLENTQLSLAKKQTEYKDFAIACEKEILVLEQEKTDYIKSINVLTDERDKELVGIPQEWLEKYELMGQKVTDPVVTIDHGSCNGCFQQLVTQDLVRARRGALLQCKKCFRLLYSADSV